MTTIRGSKVRKVTWLGVAGEAWESSKGNGKRWSIRRWSTSGEAEVVLIEGDGRTPNSFIEHRSAYIGVVPNIESAVNLIAVLLGAA